MVFFVYCFSLEFLSSCLLVWTSLICMDSTFFPFFLSHAVLQHWYCLKTCSASSTYLGCLNNVYFHASASNAPWQNLDICYFLTWLDGSLGKAYVDNVRIRSDQDPRASLGFWHACWNFALVVSVSSYEPKLPSNFFINSL